MRCLTLLLRGGKSNNNACPGGQNPRFIPLGYWPTLQQTPGQGRKGDMMPPERRHPLNEEDIVKLAEQIVAKIACKKGCPLSESDLAQVKSMIGIKKGSIKLVLYFGTALLLLVLKDIYDFVVYILKHLTITRT